MKKYEFIGLKTDNNPVTNAFLSEHRRIISAKAEEGYCYIGFIPTKQGASGKTVELDLIFETEV